MDYSIYRRNSKEWMKFLAIWSVICILFGLLFYKNIFGIIILLPLGFIYEKIDTKKQIKTRRETLSNQFTEALHVMSASLGAGTSLEKAIPMCRKQLSELYRPDDYIMRELKLMERQLACNVRVEHIFLDLGKRSGVRDIEEFAEVCAVSKRAGGNIVKVMEHTVKCIDARKSMERDIYTITSGKRLEGHIMDLMLPGILLYLNFSMPEMMQNMYTGIAGRLIMTAVLILYFATFLMMEKITDIKV